MLSPHAEFPCDLRYRARYTQNALNKRGSFCQKHYFWNSMKNAGWLCVACRDADGAVLPGSFLSADGHVEDRLYCCRQRPGTKRNSYFMITSSNVNILRAADRSGGQFNGHQWIPRTKASDAELWCFIWFVPELTVSKHSWGWWFETQSR